MSVFAISAQVQPTTNKRNAALISKHMEEALGVPAARGYLRFVPLQEDNVAYNGKTLSGELDDIEKASAGGLEEDKQGSPVRRTRSKKMVTIKVSR